MVGLYESLCRAPGQGYFNGSWDQGWGELGALLLPGWQPETWAHWQEGRGFLSRGQSCSTGGWENWAGVRAERTLKACL